VEGRFIAARSTSDAYVAVGNVLSLATAHVLMVDPFADYNIVQLVAPSKGRCQKVQEGHTQTRSGEMGSTIQRTPAA
jgi:hypothetical protein